MTRKLFVALFCVTAAVALMTVAADAKSNLARGKRYVDYHTNRVKTYGFPVRQPVTRDNEPDNPTPTTATSANFRVSIGYPMTAGDAASPGFTVDVSYNDDQYVVSAPHQVDWRGVYPDIQFGYCNADAPTDPSRFGYNVYNPTAGNWPQGAEMGCQVQGMGDYGEQVDLALTSAGRVVLAGVDGASLDALDNHFYYPQNRFSCTFGIGTIIAHNQYRVNFLDTFNLLHYPRVESQTVSGTTYTHVVAVESEAHQYAFGYFQNTLHYFRKIGTSQSGSWAGPVTIDTILGGPESQRLVAASIISSRISGKVAIAYVVPTSDGLLNLQIYDNDVWTCESDNAGDSWGPRTNLTAYSRIYPAYTANPGAYAFYDTQDYLHVLFSASPVEADPYGPSSFFIWGDYSCSLFHWSKRIPGPNAGGTISKVHNAEWGIDLNSQVCGFGDPGTGYIGHFSLAECDGRLYVTFTQFLDYFGLWGPSQIDDCAVGATDRQYAANGEIAVCVSADLDGLLWDAARNLTNTYTPDCDSAGGLGGECANDHNASMSRFGMNVNSFDTNGIPVTLNWPGTELVVPAGGTADSMFLHVFYTADKFPSTGWRDQSVYNRVTANPLKWMRLACVDPIQAPRIFVSPNLIAYPEYTKHGVMRNYTITVTNEGNQDLHINTIGTQKTSPLTPNWLTVSTGSLTVPAGQLNTGTFAVTLNASGLINSPGTVVLLNGEVYLKSDATAPRDSVSIFIENFVVADTVVGLSFDTVVSCGLKLIVDNHGNMGRMGIGHVNLDYADIGECNPVADVYLNDGGPIIIRNLGGGNYVFSNALFQDVFSTPQSFKPYPGNVPGSFVGPGYDGYSTGAFVTRDTAIGLRLRYYGPTTGGDSCDFIIQQMKVFKMSPGTLSGVTIGQAIDWDIWSDSGSTNSDNRSAVNAYGDFEFIYQRGVDTGAVTGCNPDSGRYGTQIVLATYTDNDSLIGNYNGSGFHSMYAQYNDSLFKYDTLSEALEADWYWDEMAIAGLRSRPGVRDFHMVTTYKHNTTVSYTDTLTCWTALTTVRHGTLNDLENNVKTARAWFYRHLCPGCEPPSILCGDVDCIGEAAPSVSDLSALIDHLFGSFTPLCNPLNADVDDYELITIMDVTALIDNLFTTFDPLTCPPTQPPLSSPVNQWNYSSYGPGVLPAGDTSVTLQIYLTNSDDVDALVLPLRIRIGDQIPNFGIPTNYFAGAYASGVRLIQEAGQALVFRAASPYYVYVPAGTTLIASIPLTIPASGSARPISVTYENVVEHYPMLVGKLPERIAVTPGGPFQLECPSNGCGDFNGDHIASVMDVNLGLQYLLRGGPPPVSFSDADADDHQYYTLHDLALVQDFVSNCATLTCPPAAGPIRPEPSDENYVRYVQCYSSPAASANLDVHLDHAQEVEWFLLPIAVNVIEYVSEIHSDTLIPTIDSITTYLNVIDSIVDQGNALLRLHRVTGGTLAPGEHKIATLHLTSPPSSNPKRVRLSLADLPPLQSGRKVNYPQLIGPAPQRVISAPKTVCDETSMLTDPCCCEGTTGNVDCDMFESVDVADLTTLIDYLFITFSPLCCPGEANINLDPGCSDVGDVSQLIDYLFVTFTPLRECR